MRVFSSISLIGMLLAPLPAEAQVVRRPFLRQIVQSPFVNELVNFGVHQFLPGFPNIPIPNLPNPPSNTTTITVDSSVKGNLDRTAANLKDADQIMAKLLESNKSAIEKQAVAPKKETPTGTSEGKEAGSLLSDEIKAAILALANVKDKKDLPEFQKKLLETLKKAQDAREIEKLLKMGASLFLEKKFPEAQKVLLSAQKIRPEDEDVAAALMAVESQIRQAEIEKALKAITQELAKVDVKFKASDVMVAKTGTTRIEILLDTIAPTNLVVTASAAPSSGKVTIDSLTIKAGERSGTLNITAAGVADAVIDINLAIAATEKTKAASFNQKFMTK